MITGISRARAPRLLAATGFLASGALLLAGCSSGSTTPSAGSTASAGAGAGGSAEFKKFAACLKSHGVTLPSGGFSGRPGGSRPSGTRPSGSFTRPAGAGASGPPSGGYGGYGGASANPSEAAAMQACASLRPTGQGGFGGGGSGGAAGGTQLTAFISCMKDNGVTVTAQQIRSINSSTDAKTVAALKVCKPLLPTGGQGAAPSATPSP
jgi:hypothetical protein